MKLTLLFCIILVYSNLVFGQYPTNLKAYFPFDGNTADTLNNSSPGIINGASYTTDRNNIVKRAFVFDGSGANVTLGTDLNYGTTSVAFWFKPGNVFQEQVMFSNWSNITQITTSQLEIRITPAGKITVAVGNSYNFPINFKLFTSTNAVDMNRWSHLTVEIKNNFTQITIYINGQIDFDAPISGISFSQCLNPIRVGARYNVITENPFMGKVDDVMIFNKALNDVEAKSIYTLTNGIKNGHNSYLDEIKVYPNSLANNEVLTISTDVEKLKVRLYSSDGKEVLYELLHKGTNSITLNLVGLPAGIYFITFEDGYYFSTKKIIYHN